MKYLIAILLLIFVNSVQAQDYSSRTNYSDWLRSCYVQAFDVTFPGNTFDTRTKEDLASLIMAYNRDKIDKDFQTRYHRDLQHCIDEANSVTEFAWESLSPFERDIVQFLLNRI